MRYHTLKSFNQCKKLVIRRKNVLTKAETCYPISNAKNILSKANDEPVIQLEHVLSDAKMCYTTRKHVIQCEKVLFNAKTCYLTRNRVIKRKSALSNAMKLLSRTIKHVIQREKRVMQHVNFYQTRKQ